MRQTLGLVTHLSALESLIYTAEEEFPSSKRCHEVSSQASVDCSDESLLSLHSDRKEGQVSGLP